ncbi:MAG: Eco57I restriction-modification methylase domain-containing protein [Anaerolineae bacterium]
MQASPVPRPSLTYPFAAASDLLARVENWRMEATRRLDTDQRGKLGQFLTPAPVARLMACMFDARPDALHLMDAGAGVGSLSAALVAQALEWESRPHTISITAYEVDPMLLGYLRQTLDACATACQSSGVRFEYSIEAQDFITSAVTLLQAESLPLLPSTRPRWNGAILNPPYHKINSNSTTRQLLRSVGIETSNLYTAFLWLALRLLEPGGEMVAITPRSFCNGPYFKPFRTALLQAMALRRLHVFDSRKKAFAGDDVLQENIILQAIKTTEHQPTVMVSSSAGSDDDLIKMRQVAYASVVAPNDPDAFIHLVPDEMGEQVRSRIAHLSTSLDTLGLVVSTGRVIDFRARPLLRAEPAPDTVPLIYPHNISQGEIQWPRGNGKKANSLTIPINGDELLVPAGFYVLVKRFSAKEERRRLVAGVYDPRRIRADRVAFENHLNYYHQQGEGLPSELACGLAAFLNSTLVDEYFRQFSGHTQVNATDLRNMKYPTRQQLVTLGQRFAGGFPAQDELDDIVAGCLFYPDNNPSRCMLSAVARMAS